MFRFLSILILSTIGTASLGCEVFQTGKDLDPTFTYTLQSGTHTLKGSYRERFGDFYADGLEEVRMKLSYTSGTFKDYDGQEPFGQINIRITGEIGDFVAFKAKSSGWSNWIDISGVSLVTDAVDPNRDGRKFRINDVFFTTTSGFDIVDNVGYTLEVECQ